MTGSAKQAAYEHHFGKEGNEVEWHGKCFNVIISANHKWGQIHFYRDSRDNGTRLVEFQSKGAVEEFLNAWNQNNGDWGVYNTLKRLGYIDRSREKDIEKALNR